MTENIKGLSKSMKYIAMFFVFVIVFSSCKHDDEIIVDEIAVSVPVPAGFSGYIYPNGSSESTPPLEAGYGAAASYSMHFEWDPMDDIDYFILIGFTGGMGNWQRFIEIPGTQTNIDINGVPKTWDNTTMITEWALNAYRSGISCPNGIDYDKNEGWYNSYKNAITIPILEADPNQDPPPVDKIIVPVPTGFSGYIYPNGSIESTPQFIVGSGVYTSYSMHFEWDPMDDIDYFELIGYTGGRMVRWRYFSTINIPGTQTSIDINGVPRMSDNTTMITEWALNAYRSGISCPNGINWDENEYWYETYKNVITIPILEAAPNQDPPPIVEEQKSNGDFSMTAWYAFAAHGYTGPLAGNLDMDTSNTISINANTTTLSGDFWEPYQGTFPSYYSTETPGWTIPTAPHIYVKINDDFTIDLREGSHADYGQIIWVSVFSDGDRVDVYFRKKNYQPPGTDNGSGNPAGEGKWRASAFAGNGTAGYGDGTGTAARFSAPQGVALDNEGNVYVADTENNRIRKITPDRVVTTLAGNSTAGYSDGTGTAARFSAPQGVALDNEGNVYIADTGNNRIRKITPDRVVTTLAGNGTAGYGDGMGTAARFSAPQGMAVDNNGNIYIADTENNRIRKITPDRVVTTLAGNGTTGYGDGTGTAARFSAPQGVTVDNNGNVYVADTGNNRIRKITPERIVITIAGHSTAGYSDGAGTAARFSTPKGITVDSNGDVYVGDTGNNRIRKILYEQE